MYSQNQQITNDSTQYTTANYSSSGAYEENYASYIQQQQPQHQNYNTYQNNYYQYYTGTDSTTYQPNYYYNDKSTYQQNDFNPSFQYNDLNSTYKSVTPPPQQTASSLYPFQSQTTALTETTPEKPMNDSGIDLISPQLASINNRSIPIIDTSSSNSSSNVNQLNNNDSIKKIQETQHHSDDEDEDDDDEEEDEITNDKENNSPKSSKNNPKKPPKPYLEIIADAILTSEVKMMQLHEIYHLMEKKFPYFAKNINKSWRNSVRHNLSLNECFVKAGRGSNGKGNYWKIHPLCEKEFIRGNFRRKSFKQLIRAGSNNPINNATSHQHIPYPVSIDYALNYRSSAAALAQYPNAYQYNFLNNVQFAQQQHHTNQTESTKIVQNTNQYLSYNKF